MTPIEHIRLTLREYEGVHIEEVAHSPYSYKMFHVTSSKCYPILLLYRFTSMGWQLDQILDHRYDHWMKWFWSTKMPKRPRRVRCP